MAEFFDLWSNGAKLNCSAALENDRQARDTPGILYGIEGSTQEVATVYVCVFDAAAGVPNANPVVPWPKEIIEVDKPGNGNFGLTIPPVGDYYANGIYVAISTTAPPEFTLSTNSLTHIKVSSGPVFGSNEP